MSYYYFYKVAQSNEKLEEIFSKKNFNEDIKNYIKNLNISDRGIALKTYFRNPGMDPNSLMELINKEIIKNKKSVLQQIVNKNKIDLLIEEYNEQKDKIKSLPRKYQEWLSNRFGKNNIIEETHPLTDCIDVLISFSNIESSVINKYNNNSDFRESIDLQVGKDITNINHLSSDDMLKIMEIYSSREALEITPKNLEGDRVGKVGSWNIWLPSSRENSITIAGYNKLPNGKLEPKTTWCTARIYNSNLFYNYIGGTNGKFLLFYIIKDNAISNNDYLSLGFSNGKPILPSTDGGASVDRDNHGLDENKLKSILGGSYQQIMDLINAKAESLGGVSPAFSIIKEAAQDIIAFNKLIEKNSYEEKNVIYKTILNTNNINNINKDVLTKIIKNGNYENRSKIIKNKNTPLYFLELIAEITDDDESNYHSKIELAKIINNPEQLYILDKLAMDKNKFVRQSVAENINTPPHILEKLSTDQEDQVRIFVALNKNTPTNVLEELSKDKSGIKYYVAINKNTPVNILETLAVDKDKSTREGVAKNKNTPAYILKNLAKEKDEYIQRQIALNSNTPGDVLKQIYKENNYFEPFIAENKNTPADVLIEIYNNFLKKLKPWEKINEYDSSSGISILKSLSGNTSTPEDILEKIYKLNFYSLNLILSNNTSTPKYILEQFKMGENKILRENAEKTLAKIANVKFDNLLKLSQSYYKLIILNEI